MFGHPEYDRGDAAAEYERDLKRRPGRVPCPRTTSPTTTPRRSRSATWRAHAQLLYTNWLNYYVYQTTPYDLNSLGTGE